MRESNIEKFKEGQYSLTPAEIGAIRARAKMNGEDPEAAVSAAREKMKMATGRLREKQAEKAADTTLQ